MKPEVIFTQHIHFCYVLMREGFSCYVLAKFDPFLFYLEWIKNCYIFNWLEHGRHVVWMNSVVAEHNITLWPTHDEYCKICKLFLFLLLNRKENDNFSTLMNKVIMSQWFSHSGAKPAIYTVDMEYC